MELNLNVAEVVQSLGGNPRSDETANLQLLANEIIILRERIKLVVDAESRTERRVRTLQDALAQAEERAVIAEEALAEIDRRVLTAKLDGIKRGVPLNLPDPLRELDEVPA